MERMKGLVKIREHTYGFLGGVFRGELTVKQLKEMIVTNVLILMIEAGCNLDLAYFKNTPIEQIERELALEYAALFIGPDEHIAPYESVFVPASTGKVGYYWSEITVDMKNWVEHYGLKVSERFSSIPDHISVELEFMEKVVGQERISWEKGDKKTAEKWIEVERTFFYKHINKWIPNFCDRVIKDASIDFYRELARFTKDFLRREGQLLDKAASG